MLTSIGNISLHLAFVAAFASGMAGVIAGHTGSRRYHAAACNGVYVTFGFLALASSILIHAFATHNFELVAVVQYSDTRMHWMYLMAAFWGGQAGSLMFWTGMLGTFSAAAVALHRKTDRALMPWFVAIVMGLATFLMFILLVKSNPFDTFILNDPPQEGKGLNPLLQTPLMVVHPHRRSFTCTAFVVVHVVMVACSGLGIGLHGPYRQRRKGEPCQQHQARPAAGCTDIDAGGHLGPFRPQ
ncbi:MAG: hypothetical protein AAFX99_30165, partial [Myxococcota bacterium]